MHIDHEHYTEKLRNICWQQKCYISEENASTLDGQKSE